METISLPRDLIRFSYKRASLLRRNVNDIALNGGFFHQFKQDQMYTYLKYTWQKSNAMPTLSQK
eukprot:15326908-Ditylum_brightwellii.AAC.2